MKDVRTELNKVIIGATVLRLYSTLPFDSAVFLSETILNNKSIEDLAEEKTDLSTNEIEYLISKATTDDILMLSALKEVLEPFSPQKIDEFAEKIVKYAKKLIESEI